MRGRCLALLLAAVALLAGCKERDPIPRHSVVLLASGGGYVLDGQTMAQDQVMAELDLLANGKRTSPGGMARLILELRPEQGVDFDRVVEFRDACAALGITKIELR